FSWKLCSRNMTISSTPMESIVPVSRNDSPSSTIDAVAPISRSSSTNWRISERNWCSLFMRNLGTGRLEVVNKQVLQQLQRAVAEADAWRFVIAFRVGPPMRQRTRHASQGRPVHGAFGEMPESRNAALGLESLRLSCAEF